jgi:cytochrome P450
VTVAEAHRIDLNAPDVVADPFEAYELIRAAGPIVFNEVLDTWLVTSLRTYRRIVADPGRFTVAGTIMSDNFGAEAYIAFDDKARHDAIRGVWAADFHRGALESDLAPLIESIVDELLGSLLEPLRDGEVVDIDATFCRDIPTYVICEMLGIPTEDHAKFAHWSDQMSGIPFVPDDERASHPAFLTAQQGATEMGDYLFAEIERQRRTGGDGLIARLVQSDVAQQMSEDSVMQNVRQLLFAGNETTANWLKNLIVTFARFADVRAIIRENRSLLPQALEEQMRWEGLVNFTPRRVIGGPVEVEGAQLAEGDSVSLLNTAVNRDPEWHENPLAFDIHREKLGHVGFGYGMHSCLGINLARVEARIALSRLLDELPEWEIAAPLDYGTNFPIRAPRPLLIAAAGA